MQLKKLEIKGFKSFGDRVEIEFHEGVTAIVGPNGCGKSNVVDAIRWVLGEQKTKTLRSDKMESVIFNGTQQRKPAQMAEVSLTFNNHKRLLPPEYTQVMITRRYYRSGESEYLLNQVPCRLKDITNLFLDTGIGSDSYAIIELKMIDEILNDKDNSRRGLFEKAAGVSKFKTRKKETFSRLQEVDADLARVDDLLIEIEKNLKNLEKQAKQAEKYFSLKNEYKAFSLQYAKKAIAKQKEGFEQLSQKMQIEVEKRKNIQEKLHSAENALEKQKIAVEQIERQLSQQQKEFNQHLTQLHNLENEVKLKTERLNFSSEKIASQKAQITQDEQVIQTLQQEMAILQNQLDIAQKNYADAERNVKELKQQIDNQRVRTNEIQIQVTQKRQEVEKTQQQLFQVKKQYEIKQSQLVAMRLQLEKLLQNDSQQSTTITQYENELAEVVKQLEETRQKLSFLQKEEQQKQQRIIEIEQEIEEIRVKLAEILRIIDAKKTEYSLTKSLHENTEGFPEALKFLRKNTEWSNNAQLLSDIIACQDDFKIAIENYLEPYINYYVVDTEMEAYKAIHFLRQDLKGKANFFVLDKLNPNGHFHTNGEIPATPALNVVETDDKYVQLIHQLLEDVYIVDNQELINNFQHLNKTFITKDGSVIKKKASLSGGSVGSFDGKRIGRLKYLEKLSTEIEDLKDKHAIIEQTLLHKQADFQALKQNTLKKAIEETQNAVNQLNEVFIAVKTKKEQIENLLSNSFIQREDLQDDINQWQYELQELMPQIKNLQTYLQDLQQGIETHQNIYQTDNELLSQLSGQHNQENIAFFQQQNKLNQLLQEINFKTQTLENLQKKTEKNQQDLKNLHKEIDSLKQNNLFDDEQIIKLRSQVNSLEQELKKIETAYYKAKGDVAEQEKNIKEGYQQKENADFVVNQLNEKLHESQILLTSIQERLAAEFNINLNLLMKDNNPALDTDLTDKDLKNLIDDLKEKIEKIGTINPMAMEAYHEIKQRHDFIQHQKNDLLTSKNSLLKTIEEMEVFANQAFMQAFMAIRENFIKVFRSLFSEQDTCDLLLLKPENPLESEIDIIAKPKGKRPLSINQLSGGEKTLTATSLLFALYLLKPAPFCIFDEVDAPLDDANTDKFNNIIKNFSAESQFLIVTHNKRTMLMADILYGVTMVEQGVSRTVPVDLQNLS